MLPRKIWRGMDMKTKESGPEDTLQGSEASFRDWVEQRQNSQGARRKGERTRDRIRLATIDLLNDGGYRLLTVADICKAAKITPPVLYLYFESKEALVHDILEEFLLEYFISHAISETARTPYKAMLDANLQWIRSARTNSGLMRCLLQFSEAQADFAELYARQSDMWAYRITQSILHRFPAAKTEEDSIHFIVHMLSGMIDEATRRLSNENDQTFIQLAAKVAKTDEELASILTTIWYRALYASNPSSREAKSIAPRLARAAQSS